MLRLKGWVGLGYFSLNWDWNLQPCAKFSAITLPGTPADKELSFDVCLLVCACWFVPVGVCLLMCKMDVFCDAGCWLQAVCLLDMIMLLHCFMISAQAQFLKKKNKTKNLFFFPVCYMIYTVCGHLLFCVLHRDYFENNFRHLVLMLSSCCL